jgi:hypothetical protein
MWAAGTRARLASWNILEFQDSFLFSIWGIAPLMNHTLNGEHLTDYERNGPTNKHVQEFVNGEFSIFNSEWPIFQGPTPLAVAASSGHAAGMSLLLDHGAKDMRILDCVTEAAGRNWRNGKEAMA